MTSAHADTLRRLRAGLHEREVLIGGSIAGGSDDEVSDLDLWVTGADVDPTQMGAILLAGRVLPFGPNRLFHGVTREGVIVDIMAGPTPYDGYVSMPSVDPLDLTGPTPAADLETDFWISSYKHRKPLFRGLDAMACLGLHHDRMNLLRLWVKADSGEDPGDQIFTIHGMTPYVQKHVAGKRRKLFGLPARDRRELLTAIDAYRSSVLDLGSSYPEFAAIVMNDPVYNGFRKDLSK